MNGNQKASNVEKFIYLLMLGCSLIFLLSAAHETRLTGYPCYTAWVVDEWKQVQNIGGIVLTGDDRNTATEALGSCDRASWANYEERKTNKMQQLGVYY